MTRPEIEAAVAAADDSLQRSRRELTEARKIFVDAENAYIDGGKRAQLEKKRDAADAMERCEVLEKRAQERLGVARAELARIDREDALARLDDLRAKLASFEAEVTQAAAEFVAIDREIERRAWALGEAISAVVQTHSEAGRLASELRVSFDAIRPDRAEIALRIRRAVTGARKQDQAEHRADLVRQYLHDAPGDWQLREMSARDLADIDRVTARNAQIERDRREANAFAAGAASTTKAAEPAPTPEETT